jgi:hypothetical protein
MSAHIWHVEGSLPPEEGRHWRKNINVTVCADSLMAAAKAVAARFDGIELHKVMRDRDAHEFIDARPVESAVTLKEES